MSFFDKFRKRSNSQPTESLNVSEGRPRSRSVLSKPPLEKLVVSQDVKYRKVKSSSSRRESNEFRCEHFRDEIYIDSKGDDTVERERLRTWEPLLNGQLSTSKSECSTKLRFLIRKGIPDTLKPQVWRAVSGVSDFTEDNPKFYKTLLMLVFGPKVPFHVRNVPSFGGMVSPSDHYLSQDGLMILKRILTIVAMSFPDLTFCPALPDVAMICMMFLPESESVAMLHVMIEQTKLCPRYYLVTSARELALTCLTFNQLISRHLWAIHKHIVLLGIDAAKEIAEPWFTRLFVSSLPYQTVLRIFDVYINEGSKILYKSGLAILQLVSQDLLRTQSKPEFMNVLHKFATSFTNADLFIKTAFKFRMNDHIHRCDKKSQRIVAGMLEPHTPVYYRPKTPLNSSTLEDEQFEIVWGWVPRRICIQDPVLIFSTDIHGCSLSTLYHMCSNVSPSILAIRTQSGAVFGAYVSDPWIVAQSPVHYGDGECFIFSLSPTSYHWPWTKENEYFMYAAHDHISVGGGSGCALWLNHSFDFCMSSMSETFRNPPLDSKSEFLGSITVEVFGFI